MKFWPLRVFCVVIFLLCGVLLFFYLRTLVSIMAMFPGIRFTPWRVCLVAIPLASGMIGSTLVLVLNFRRQREESRRGFPISIEHN